MRLYPTAKGQSILMNEFLTIILITQLVFLSITSFIVIFNFFTAPKLKNKKYELSEYPLVSVLIPARNEEDNIGNIVSCVLKQDYPNFELIVLNDNSEDGTLNILQEIQKKDSKLKIINGKPLPSEWIGKSWACHQLSQEAKGEYLLFIDADVLISKNAIGSAVYNIKKFKSKLLSSFSTQIMKTLGERLIVPTINWQVLTILPLILVNKFKSNFVLAANGQFLMVEKSTYSKLGGHEAIKSINTEDMNIARNFKKNNFKIITTLGDETVFCRMYSNFQDAYEGWARSIYNIWLLPAIVYFGIITLTFIVFLLPVILIPFNTVFIVLTLAILVQRIIISLVSNQNLLSNVILHPIQIMILLSIAVSSYFKSRNQNLTWKGRKIINKI